MRRQAALVWALSLLVAVTLVAVAQADPGGKDGADLQAHFFDCSGPAGTPSSFDAGRENVGAAWHLTDSKQIFNQKISVDETTGRVVEAPGFDNNAVDAVTC